MKLIEETASWPYKARGAGPEAVAPTHFNAPRQRYRTSYTADPIPPIVSNTCQQHKRMKWLNPANTMNVSDAILSCEHDAVG